MQRQEKLLGLFGERKGLVTKQEETRDEGRVWSGKREKEIQESKRATERKQKREAQRTKQGERERGKRAGGHLVKGVKELFLVQVCDVALPDVAHDLRERKKPSRKKLGERPDAKALSEEGRRRRRRWCG